MENNLLKDKVITTINKNVAVSAGAGSGKTFSLAKRFVYILMQNKQDPKFMLGDIVAVTFTRMAALEMRERVRSFLWEEIQTDPMLQKYLDDFERAQILTLDSLQGRILRSHPVEAGLDPDFAVLEGEEYDATIEKLSRQFLRDEAIKGNVDLQLVLKYFDISILRGYLYKTRKARRLFDFAEDKLLEPYNNNKDIFDVVRSFWHLAELYNEFIGDALAKQNVLGHDDVTARCIKLLREYGNVRKNYQRQIKFLMVDEFQDTNDAQRELIYLLCGDGKNSDDLGKVLDGNKLFVVGDVKQSIYKFRGADVEVFKEVQDAIKEKFGERFTRTVNYRSTDKILQFVNTVFADNLMFGEKFEALEPSENNISKAGHQFELPIFNVFLPDGIELSRDRKELLVWEAEYVARRIEELVAQGAKYGDIAILLSKMTKAALLEKALAQHNIPYVQLGGRGFYQTQEVYDMLNLFRLLQEDNLLALLGVLRSPLFGLSDVEINNLFRQYRVQKNGYISDTENAELCQKILSDDRFKVLVQLRQATQYLDMAELWQEVFEKLAISKIMLNTKHGEQHLANVEKLRTLSVEYCENNNCGLTEWLTFLDKVMATSKETEANLPADAMVKIMTIHKSKGLGFDHVILPFLAASKGRAEQISFDVDTKNGLLGIKVPNMEDASVWDEFKQNNDYLNYEEEKRKLYVAITRAKKTLYMSCSLKEIEKIETKTDFAALLWRTLHIQNIIPPQGRQRKPRVAWELKPDIVQLNKKFADYFTENDIKIDKLPTDINKNSQAVEFVANTNFIPLTTVFTPSMLQCYLHCEREYFYRYLCHLPSYDEKIIADTNNGGVSAATQGTIIHTALEHYHGDGHKAFKQAIKLCAAENMNLQIARNLFNNYVSSDLFKQIPDNHERELAFQLSIDNGVVFKGIIDCLYLKKDCSYGIIDYKTGVVPETLNDGYAMQLAIYSRAVKIMKKADVSALALHYLQGLKAFNISEDMKFYDKAINLAKEIQSKNVENQFRGNGICQYCSYRYLCTACRVR